MAPTKTELPNYTRKQEIANSLSHALGILFAIIGGPFLIAKAVDTGDAWKISSSVLFTLAILTLYSGSAIYHGLRPSTLKRVFRVLDHDNVFILIIGTYIPYTLVALRQDSPAWAYSIFGLVIGLGILGIVLNSIDLKRFIAFCVTDYVLMGWCILLSFYPLIQSIGWYPGTFLLFLGGVSYTIGAVLYTIGRKKSLWFHTVFHVFVLLGTLPMFLSIYFYVI